MKKEIKRAEGYMNKLQRKLVAEQKSRERSLPKEPKRKEKREMSNPKDQWQEFSLDGGSGQGSDFFTRHLNRL